MSRYHDDDDTGFQNKVLRFLQRSDKHLSLESVQKNWGDWYKDDVMAALGQLLVQEKIGKDGNGRFYSKVDGSADIARLDAYKKLYDEKSAEINKHIDVARKALRAAEEIADKYGVPFSTPVSPIHQNYSPSGIEDTTGLSMDELREILGDEDISVENEYGSGWEHSAVC